MASTYRELYDDWVNTANLYTERLQVTERQFLRFFTRGVQILQRETEFLTRTETITGAPDTDGNTEFVLPDDVLRVLSVKDQFGYELRKNDWAQLREHRERATTTGKVTNPLITSSRTIYPNYEPDTAILSSPIPPTQTMREYADREGYGNPRSSARLFAIEHRRLIVFPNMGDTDLLVKYVPDFIAYSDRHPRWADMNANFGLFDTETMPAELSPYEKSCVDYALAELLKALGSANYMVYEKAYWEEVERAKANKVTYFTEATRDYYMSPRS